MARNKFDVDETLESPFSFSHLKRAMQYIKRHKFKMIAALLLSALASVAGLFGPKIMQWTLEDAVPNKDVKLLGLLAVCIAVYALLVKREASSGARKALAATGIVLAVAFAFACGVSYMMTSRPVWNTVALPLAYLGTALATGAALYLVMCAALKVDEGDVKKAGVYAAAGGALSLVLTVAFGLVSGTAFGDQAALFWVAVVLCGSAAPAVCGVLVARKSGGALSLGVVALAGALVGSVAVRAVMWLVGTAVANYFGFAL